MPNLTNIPALDVVIGLAFVYFILSVVLSSVTEAISAVFQVRWKKLDQGLRELFVNPDADPAANEEGKELWKTFQKNPRIKALWKQTGALGARGPSYIPPRVLALTLLDTLVPPLDTPPTDDQVKKARKAADDAKAAADAAAATAEAVAASEAAADPTDDQVKKTRKAADDAKAAADAAAATAEAVAAAKAAADAEAEAAADPTDDQVKKARKAADDAKAAADAAAAKAVADPSDDQAAAHARAATVAAAAKAAKAEAVAAAKAAADAEANAAVDPTDDHAVADAKTARHKATVKAVVAKAKQMVSDHDLVARAERAAGEVENPLLRKWLLDALTEVAGDREKILTSLESSFDSVTNRVSGWYKRYSAIVVAVLAFVAAGALNVDSYALGSRLWKDDAVRSAIANQAANLTAAKCPQPTNKSNSGRGTGGNTGTSTTGTTGTTSTTGTRGTTSTSSATQPKLSLEVATQCVTHLRALGLPIGWAKENRPNTGWGWVSKAFGVIVTAFALMLGAPFWFDTLSKIARLRSTGNPEGTAKKNG